VLDGIGRAGLLEGLPSVSGLAGFGGAGWSPDRTGSGCDQARAGRPISSSGEVAGQIAVALTPVRREPYRTDHAHPDAVSRTATAERTHCLFRSNAAFRYCQPSVPGGHAQILAEIWGA
jgi:hypothetical protein